MENSQYKNSKTFLPSSISSGEDLTAVLRNLALLLIFIAPISPETVNKAGFEEGSFIGMKWKKGIAKSDIALKRLSLQ